ncbi:MAG: glycosyltransferase family 4 protein [Vulcanimicrobiaceae bacterium]
MSAQTICHVIDYGAPTGGSFIPGLESLARALSGRGDRFVVFATEIPGATWPRELAQAGADVRFIRDDGALIAGLRDVRPDVIHSHFTRFDLAVLQGGKGARIFWHVHSHREDLSAFAKLKAFAKYRILGARVEAWVAVSQAMRKECVEWFAPRDRVRVVHNGIDPDRFRPPTDQERAAARRTFEIASHDRVVLFFERVPYKGGVLVREALRELPDHRLLVTGGTQADRDRFGTLPGVIATERVADARQLYWAADALAFASDHEAFGLVLVEALACGVPVAASDIPAVHEICGEVESVFIFPVGDSHALARALEAALRCAQVQPGRARVIERFSLERWTSDTMKLYDG